MRFRLMMNLPLVKTRPSDAAKPTELVTLPRTRTLPGAGLTAAWMVGFGGLAMPLLTPPAAATAPVCPHAWTLMLGLQQAADQKEDQSGASAGEQTGRSQAAESGSTGAANTAGEDAGEKSSGALQDRAAGSGAAGPKADADAPAGPEIMLGPLSVITLEDVKDWKPEDFIREIEALAMPEVDASRLVEPEYREELNRMYTEVVPKKFDYIAAFFHLYPEHPALKDLLDHRWSILDASPRRFLIPRETKALLEKYPDIPAAESAQEWSFYIDTLRAVGAAKPDIEKLNTAVLTWSGKYPKDPRTLNILMEGAKRTTPGTNEQSEMLRRVLKHWPDHTLAGLADGMMRRWESVGLPFELTFEDVRSGDTVNLPEDTRGKVVAVYFFVSWAPFCRQYVLDTLGPLHEIFHDDGFEVIGISIDDPESNNGRQDLIDYLDQRDIPFRVYYQGKAWLSEFSMSWGVYRSPDVMLVDQAGLLVDADALADLKTAVPELLGKPVPTEEEYKAAEKTFFDRRKAVEAKAASAAAEASEAGNADGAGPGATENDDTSGGAAGGGDGGGGAKPKSGGAGG